MSSKKLVVTITAAIIVQVALLSYLSLSHIVDDFIQGGSVRVLIIGLVFLPASIVVSYALTQFSWIPVWVKRNKYLAIILLVAFLYILSVLLYVNAVFIAR